MLIKKFSKKYIIALVVIVALIAIAVVGLYPVKVACKVPGNTCVAAPDSNGLIYISYDVEPLFVREIEKRTHEDFPFRYKGGTDTSRVFPDPDPDPLTLEVIE